MLKIRNTETGEVCDLIRDVCHNHPEWVHEQLGTEAEAELQHFLDSCSYEEFQRYPGQEDVAGVFLPLNEEFPNREKM